MTNKLDKSYINQIPADMDLRKAYLFGSYAKGSEREDSDIDVALITGKQENIFHLQMRLMRLRRKIDLRFEPHPIAIEDFTNDNPFAYEVKATGIELMIDN